MPLRADADERRGRDARDREGRAGGFRDRLGSGDGRIVIAAAKKHGARGFGVEIDGALVSDARREAERQGVAGRAEFRAQPVHHRHRRATVLTMYLFPAVNMQLRPRLFAQLKPGTRVVSHEFDFGNWKPDERVKVPFPDKPYGPPSSDVYLWIVPANAAGAGSGDSTSAARRSTASSRSSRPSRCSRATRWRGQAGAHRGRRLRGEEIASC